MTDFTKKIGLLFVALVLGLSFASCKTITIEESTEDDSTMKNITEEVAETEPEVAVAEPIYDAGDFMPIDKLNPLTYFEPPKVKGLYVSSVVQNPVFMDQLLDIADNTEINAFVIDVKSDDGVVTYQINVPSVTEVDSAAVYINDIDALMDVLYEHNIYPIARIVSFKDPYLASQRNDLAIKNRDGSLWVYNAVNWVNPYNKKSWDYLLDIAKQAGLDGFKEIQFDYIRFAEGNYSNVDFDGLAAGDDDKRNIILEYTKTVRDTLNKQGLVVSADVFGTIITSEYDAKTVGQDYLGMSENLDVICPMVYPSHYGQGYFGTPPGAYADFYPYEIIKGSMEASAEMLAGSDKEVAIVRPWLQAFTASYLGAGRYMEYDKKAIRDQIRGAYDAGLEEWIFWHAGVRYDKDWFEKEDA